MTNTAFKDDPINDGIGDTGSMVASGIAAGIIAPAIVAVPFLVGGPLLFTGAFLATSIYALTAGLVRNAENERAVGGFLDRQTSWTLPTGISWWFPAPFGKALQRRRVDQSVLVLRKGSIKGSIPQVQTADGGQVDVQVTLTWRVVDVVKTSRLPAAELEARVEGLLDRQVRFFALGFESDSDDESRRLIAQKLPFSAFLVGETHYKSDGNTMQINDMNGNPLTYDTKERCGEIGIAFERAEVHDVNPPQEVIDARNKQAAEVAQAVQEQEDMSSLRNRINELMYGTSDKDELVKLKRRKPLMTVEAATLAARAARGDVTDINVGGTGGDFTKAAALTGVGIKGKGSEK
jgi:regulator of protease activity HflC (stomatin/prohibitin superfamily)